MGNDITRRDHGKSFGRPTTDTHVFHLQPFKGFRLEMGDVHFHHDSAVLLPDYDVIPDASRITALAVLAAGLNHAKKNPAQLLLIAGHTDTTGRNDYNLGLSELRAQSVYFALIGDKDGWVGVAKSKNKVEDYQLILKWAHEDLGYDSDPGTVDNQQGPLTSGATLRFQKEFNKNKGASIPENGVVGPDTWGAFFTLYMDVLRELLKVDAAGLAAMQGGLKWVQPGVKMVGCGEEFPIDAPSKNSYYSKTNRRVEMLFFDPGQEPKLDCHSGKGKTQPILCEIYNPWMYRFTNIPATPIPAVTPGDLEVNVTDANTGAAVEGAEVKVAGPEPQTGKTDASGKAAFPGIRPGAYTADVTCDGYVPGNGAGTVAPTAKTTVDVKLTPGVVTLTVDGVAAANKSAVGGLIVRNFDGNKAPRKKITISAVTPAGVTGKVIFQCDSAKVKFFSAATGGAAIALDGSANAFAPGALPKDLFAEGVDASDAMRDINISLDFGPRKKIDAATLTVLWLDQPTVRLAGTMSANNDKRNAYKGWTKAGTFDLGLQEYNANFGARMGWGSEASAKVHPAKFNYPGNDLKLERDFDYRDYNGSTQIDSGARSASVPPGNDTGPAAARDDNPDPDDTIYDWDAAGLNIPNAPKNTIHRTRNNFWAFASITVEGKSVRCSQIREYFIAFSQEQTAAPSGKTWVKKSPPDVAGDNNAGNGTTKTTWDLK